MSLNNTAGNSRPTVDCSTHPSRTKQSFKAECDINNIVKRYRKTGLVTHLAKGVPSYADISSLTDYRQAIHAVRDGAEFFSGLDANVREAFENDPAAFVEYMTDPRNDGSKLRDLGVALLDDDTSNDAIAIAAANIPAKPATPAPTPDRAPATAE